MVLTTWLVLTPWLLLIFISNIIMKDSFINLTPIWSDELVYWHEAYSFIVKGLNHGYYTFNELTPHLFSFGTHGFGTATIYFLIAGIIGWGYNSIVLANTIIMSLSFLIISIWTNTSVKKTIYIFLLYIFYTPLVLYATTSMSELMQHAFLIIYFLLLLVYYQKKENRNLVLVGLILFCTALSFIRIINIILFLPVIYIKLKGLVFNKKGLIYLILWIAFSLILFKINSLFTSPYPWSFLYKLNNTSGIIDSITFLLKHIIKNSVKFIYPFSGDIIQVLQRYFFLFVCAYYIYKSKIFQTKFKAPDISYLVLSIILSGFMTINIIAYDINSWRDYRVLSPVLFGSIIFLLLQNKFFLPKISIAINIIFLLIITFNPGVKGLFFNTQRYDVVKELPLMKKVVYTNNFISKFENTMVVNRFDKNIFLNTPPGIGITYTKEFTDNFQSYYLLTDKFYELPNYDLIENDNNLFLYKKKEH